MAGEHATEDWRRTLFRLRVRAAEADEPFGAVLPGRQRAEMGAHVPQTAARGKRGPFLGGRIAQAVFAMHGVVESADRLPVLLDHLRGIELGVDHHGVEARMAEQGLNDVDRHVVVQVIGREDATTIVGQEDERPAVRSTCTGGGRDGTQSAANRLDAEWTRMFGALQQVRRARSGLPFVMVPMIAGRHGRRAIEPLHMADDLGDHATETVADRNHARAIKLRRFDMEHVVHAPIRELALQNVERRELAGLFDAETALDQQFDERPVPERRRFGGGGSIVGLVRNAVLALFHCWKAYARIVGISRSRSSTVAVRRACVRARACSKPMPTRSRRINGTTRGACGANGESGSVAHVQTSAKKVRTSSSQTCGIKFHLIFSGLFFVRKHQNALRKCKSVKVAL